MSTPIGEGVYKTITKTILFKRKTLLPVLSPPCANSQPSPGGPVVSPLHGERLAASDGSGSGSGVHRMTQSWNNQKSSKNQSPEKKIFTDSGNIDGGRFIVVDRGLRLASTQNAQRMSTQLSDHQEKKIAGTITQAGPHF